MVVTSVCTAGLTVKTLAAGVRRIFVEFGPGNRRVGLLVLDARAVHATPAVAMAAGVRRILVDFGSGNRHGVVLVLDARAVHATASMAMTAGVRRILVDFGSGNRRVVVVVVFHARAVDATPAMPLTLRMAVTTISVVGVVSKNELPTIHIPIRRLHHRICNGARLFHAQLAQLLRKSSHGEVSTKRQELDSKPSACSDHWSLIAICRTPPGR